MAIRAPQALTPDHLLDAFDSGKPTLDRWLREQALARQRTATTYVISDTAQRVVAYYCLSSGALIRPHLRGSARARKGLPDPIPVILMGRLAVDKACQGRGLGADLLQDAAIRAIEASRQIAACGMLVHALDDRSVAFYRRWGFVTCRDHPLTLVLPLTP